MPSKFMRFRLGRTWWWVFSILIACPALVLALLGLRAIRTDRIERELQLRDRQTQTARLADAAIQNAVERIAAQLGRLDVDLFGKPARVTLDEPDLPVFVLDRGDVLSFPLRRVYFGEIGRRPEFLKLPGDLSPSALQGTAQAQAMEAQHRNLEAIALYQQARQNLGLRDWADLALDRLNRQGEQQPDERQTTQKATSRSALSRLDRLADPRRARSEGYTPGGVPVAIVASSAVEQVAAEDRPRFAPLLDQTLGSLREDLWWLSYEQRSEYDGALQRWLRLVGAPATTSADARLAEVVHSQRAIRRAGQHRGGPPRLETETGQAYLIVWSRTGRDSVSIGSVLSGEVLKGFFNALATYVRTIRSGNSRFDRYAAGQANALNALEKAGLALFRGKARCTICHSGPNFTDDLVHNTGVAWKNGTFTDEGRFAVSSNKRDRGAFNTPTLREISRTAPYMHDGSLRTLEEVVDFYSEGGRRNPFIAAELRATNLAIDAKRAILAFLRSLNGQIREGL